jgi:HD-GYP domain-containing protein (c-di-GMP phosphodiesterase class II)
VMASSGLEGARATGQRLIAALERSGIVTVSVGVAVDAGAGDLDGLLADAAEVLERARRAGGGQVGASHRSAREGGSAGEPSRGAVGALALTLAERDPGSGEHAEKVVALAAAVAGHLGLDGEEVERVAAAALLHDVGKVCVPDAILGKPGPLTDEDRAILHEHPVVGERILRAVPGMGPIARVVRHAHERYDGAGYPDGLRGEEIPLGSRIVQACDAYDAMISPRPFRAALAHDEAVSELVAGAGTQFDARVIDALVRHLAERHPVDYAARSTA